jgi:hypothetical protein
MGNIHLSPVSRLFRTEKLSKVTSKVKTPQGEERVLLKRRGSSNAEPTLREIPYSK